MFDLRKAIIPVPVKAEDKKEFVKIGKSAKDTVSFSCCGKGSVFRASCKYIENTLNDYLIGVENGEYKISLYINPEDKRFEDCGKKDAYFIDIDDEKAELCGYDEGGAYYSAVSFAKLLHKEGEFAVLPKCFILDYPHFSIRSHFMECRYGSDFMTLEDWKDAVDYLADMKMNHIIIGLYGCWGRQYDNKFAEYQYIPFKKYPELNTPRDIKYYSAKQKKMIYKHDVLPTMYEDDYFGELIAYAKTKNVTVIPLFNSLGHNTLIPRVFPEISAVNENGEKSGFGFCTNNEKTYEVMFNIYDEIIERYLEPNGIDSFHIGLDEVWNMIGFDDNNLQAEKSPFCQCEKCRGTEYIELMIQYIIRIVKHLQKKGMKNVFIYHDMLFKAGVLNEELAERFKKEGVWDTIVIDWWSYHADYNALYSGMREKVNGCFRSTGKPITGYYHWTLPTQNNININYIADIAKKNGFEGLSAYSSFEYCYDFNYNYYAQACWNPENLDIDKITNVYSSLRFSECPESAEQAIIAANDIMNDGFSVGTSFLRKSFEYYQHCYLQRDREYPQDYPSAAFKNLKENEDDYLEKIADIKEKAHKIYEYFDNNLTSKYADIWKLNMAIYETLCDSFLTVYVMADKYAKKEASKSEFIAELERATALKDKTIALCEDVRIPANQYVLIRNMTVARQFVCDLCDYLRNNEVKEVDIFDFSKYLSDLSWFLR